MTATDEMIECVARAICVAERMNPDDKLGGWVHWKEAALSVIDAMSPYAFDADQVIAMLRKACAEAGGAGPWAKSHGLPLSNIYDVLNGKKRMGNQIPAALGLKKVWIPIDRGN